MNAARNELSYSAASAELEDILEQLANENIDVDELAVKVERAAELIRICRGRIRAAQLNVQEIVADLDDSTTDGEATP